MAFVMKLVVDPEHALSTIAESLQEYMPDDNTNGASMKAILSPARSLSRLVLLALASLGAVPIASPQCNKPGAWEANLPAPAAAGSMFHAGAEGTGATRPGLAGLESHSPTATLCVCALYLHAVVLTDLVLRAVGEDAPGFVASADSHGIVSRPDDVFQAIFGAFL
jgi:hypothetical protein